jgi:endonuclease-3
VKNLEKIIFELDKHTKKFSPPLINTVIDEYGKQPFLILIACLLSLRTKDVMTIHVVRDLFNRVAPRPDLKAGRANKSEKATQGLPILVLPQDILQIKLSELEKIIFRTGFYKNKAKVLREVCNTLIEKFGGQVPSSYEELISINGVGPKTANLVLGMAFDVPAICVDTHVHRISNRLGIIKTKTAEQTLIALEKVLPRNRWILWNKLLVIWGQNVCLPRAPKCAICAINKYCAKVGVKRFVAPGCSICY